MKIIIYKFYIYYKYLIILKNLNSTISDERFNIKYILFFKNKKKNFNYIVICNYIYQLKF